MKGVTSISKSTVKDLMKLPSEMKKLLYFRIYAPDKIGIILPTNGFILTPGEPDPEIELPNG